MMSMQRRALADLQMVQMFMPASEGPIVQWCEALLKENEGLPRC
jgi:hypothetical protein